MKPLAIALGFVGLFGAAMFLPGCAECERTTTRCVLWGCGEPYNSSGKCYSPVCIQSAPVTERYYSGGCHDGDREVTK